MFKKILDDVTRLPNKQFIRKYLYIIQQSIADTSPLLKLTFLPNCSEDSPIIAYKSERALIQAKIIIDKFLSLIKAVEPNIVKIQRFLDKSQYLLISYKPVGSFYFHLSVEDFLDLKYPANYLDFRIENNFFMGVYTPKLKIDSLTLKVYENEKVYSAREIFVFIENLRKKPFYAEEFSLFKCLQLDSKFNYNLESGELISQSEVYDIEIIKEICEEIIRNKTLEIFNIFKIAKFNKCILYCECTDEKS